MSGSVRHLYLHLPFCAHRCGYCDFVTVVGHRGAHATYVEALLAELELEGGVLAPKLETVFLGGGTPTLLAPADLARLLARLPPAEEVTVEANPETMTPALAALLRDRGVTRVSLGAQTFEPSLLAVLERRARPDDVRRAFYDLRDADFDNISLDLLYGIPGQGAADLIADLEELLQLAPEHVSYYELEAKPGTRFTYRHGAALAEQREAMEEYFEAVVDVLEAAGYRWYETSSFCRGDARSRHNLGYWRGHDYLGVGIGAVSTVGGMRSRNRPSLARYLAACLRGEAPERDLEQLEPDVQACERVMLGLRLDEPLETDGLERVLNRGALARLERLGLVEDHGFDKLRLTRRGRFLGSAVTAALLEEIPANQPVPAGASASIGS